MVWIVTEARQRAFSRQVIWWMDGVPSKNQIAKQIMIGMTGFQEIGELCATTTKIERGRGTNRDKTVEIPRLQIQDVSGKIPKEKPNLEKP